MIFQERYEELLDICRQITTHRQKLAKPKIENLIVKHIDPNVPNRDLLSHLIAESLLKRIDKKLLESKNIYIQQFDIPQIVLFYSMAEAIPFVFAGHSLANRYLAKAIEHEPEATVVDIGIGKGLQCQRLLEGLRKVIHKLQRLHIIGIDPDESNLKATGLSIDKVRDTLPFEVQYHPMKGLIEEFKASDYRAIKNVGGNSIVVNSAFAFHHTAHPLGDNEVRTELLRNLAALKPLTLTLVEPNSDHDTEQLTKRFHNSWLHFGTVFQLIDEAKIEPSHKFIIKEKFFGREIRDIFGVSDHFRCERHELYDSWLLRLFKAGFRPIDAVDMDVNLPEYCTSNVSEGLIRMNYNDTTVVAVLAYTI